jgi:hypothetical protein
MTATHGPVEPLPAGALSSRVWRWSHTSPPDVDSAREQG